MELEPIRVVGGVLKREFFISYSSIFRVGFFSCLLFQALFLGFSSISLRELINFPNNLLLLLFPLTSLS